MLPETNHPFTPIYNQLQKEWQFHCIIDTELQQQQDEEDQEQQLELDFTSNSNSSSEDEDWE